MEYLQNVPSQENTPNKILCCECGTSIEPNPANMCVGCIRTRVDITEGIPKQVTLQFCRGCERYFNPPSEWIHCVLESKELLSLCLKKLKGLNRVKLVDASFVWTEPHSKRIKVKLTVHAEVLGGATLQQVFVVDYIVNNHMCDDCHRTEAKDFWKAVVQVRQKTENKKTFYYLEQLILKHKAHDNTLAIKPVNDGLDFFYAGESHARKMVDFLMAVLPCKYTHSKKLMSHDTKSNIYNYKYTYSVEIVPISKDSLICLPKKLQQQLGAISPLCLVYRMTSTIHLIDPSRAQIAEVNSTVYWRTPFNSVFEPKQLVEYVVMDIEPIMDKDRRTFPGQGALSNKHVLADIWVVRASELGVNDSTIHTRTHLGHVLKPGDYVLGYNLEDSNINDRYFEKLDKSDVPDVILVKKYYEKSERRRRRIWKLKHMAEEETALIPDTNDYNEFLDDLEEDPDLRQNINIFKDSSKLMAVDSNEILDENIPQITLEEMLDDLVIEDVEMAEQ